MPLFRKIEQFNRANVGLWKIQESENELLEVIRNKSFDLSQIRQYHVEAKRKQWLASRCLISEMNQDIGFISYDENGAPHTNIGMEVSFSHSYEMVACILDEKKTGIDIQKFTPKIHRIKEKFCSEQELNFASRSNELPTLHLLWCAKEALYKQFNHPGVIFKEALILDEFVLKEEGVLTATCRVDGKEERRKLKYEIIHDFTLVFTLNT